MFTASPLPVRRVHEHPLAPAPKGQWPATIAAVHSILKSGLDLSPITVIVGENGSGKSTIVEAIAEAFGLNVEGGTHNARHRTHHSESGLADHLQLVRDGGASRKGVFLRAETMHGHLAYLDDLEGPGSARHNLQSHGESFIEFFRDRAGIQGLWVFDEAESALSFNGCLALVAQMIELVRQGSQVIVSTHSPVLASVPGAQIIELTNEGLTHKDYDELELVQNWRLFLEGPERFLRHLR